MSDRVSSMLAKPIRGEQESASVSACQRCIDFKPSEAKLDTIKCCLLRGVSQSVSRKGEQAQITQESEMWTWHLSWHYTVVKVRREDRQEKQD